MPMGERGSCRWAVAAATVAGAMVSTVPVAAQQYRSIDGSGNNVAHPDWGSTFIQLLRHTPPSYADGASAPAGASRPSARYISNGICAQPGAMPNSENATNFLWQWGQFVDHDIDLSDSMQPLEPFPIPVPMGDPVFDPDSTGRMTIPLDRSIYDPATGTDPKNPRQQLNQITAFLDGSQVYGSDPVRAAALRANDGTGRLKTGEGNLLPFNTEGLPNLGGPDPSLFLAGDIRANEQVGLTSMHTLFMREHNRQADLIAAEHPEWSDEQIYQKAKARVNALIQVITYHEFLPILLGQDALAPYQGYLSDVNPGIANIFSTSAYRVGHTLLSSPLLRLDASGQEIPEGNLPLQDAFFAVWRITDEGGIEPILRGLASAPAQEIDPKVIDDVRNFLFLAPSPAGLDLAALNMQRGRDHGLPTYNQVRVALGLEPMASFSDMTPDPDMAKAYADVYKDVNDVDVWVGALAEEHVPGAMVGELIFTVLKDQFERLRDGDRFWYARVFSGAELADLEGTRLSDVIRRNTPIGDEIQDDAFHMAPACPADLSDNGAVDFADILVVIQSWGEGGGPADLNGDGTVNFADLLEVLIAWGPCP